MSNQTQTPNEAELAPQAGSEELLKDTLKRCSKETLDAALTFRKTGDASLVPTIVLGIVERFLDPEVIDLLKKGDDSVRFMEDLGLDSLTMIEAIMMVEESLGVSIKNEELLDLRTIGDLKAFIDRKVAGETETSSAKSFTVEQVAAIMPQQDPFLFLHGATLNETEAEGFYKISGNEEFLKGHFKDNPIFPASIMLEALGQLAVLSLIKNPPAGEGTLDTNEIYFTGVDGVRCHRVCKPGEELSFKVKLKRFHEPLAVFSGQIEVDGEKAVVAEEISLAYRPVGESTIEEKGDSVGNG
ncbi:MAG: phosphopantetheine-binding protein [Verrucomicrobiota bacterium]